MIPSIGQEMLALDEVLLRLSMGLFTQPISGIGLSAVMPDAPGDGLVEASSPLQNLTAGLTKT